MNDKEKMKKFADGLRETASVIDEIVENDDEEKEEELLGKFVVKLMKLEELKGDLQAGALSMDGICAYLYADEETQVCLSPANTAERCTTANTTAVRNQSAKK